MGHLVGRICIVALRNEKGSYNIKPTDTFKTDIVALRNEKGSYNVGLISKYAIWIVALRNEKGSYNLCGFARLAY